MFQAILINGLMAGGAYAILAVGFSLVFGVANILNMAHTTFYMITAFSIFITFNMLGFPLPLSIILGILIAGIIGLVCYKLFFDRIKEQQTAVMIVSVSLALLFQEIFLIGFGARYQGIPSFVSGSFDLYGVGIPFQHIFTIGATCFTLISLWLLLLKSRLGNAIRAIAQDSEIANLMGIDVSRVCAITMTISGILAGISGAILAPIFMVHPFMWIHPLVIVLAAVVLGGLGSIKGSIIASFVLGFAEAMVGYLIPGGSFLKGAVSLSVMVAVLMVKPEGLFGVFFEEEML